MVSYVLFASLLLCTSVCYASFSWSNCGTQLHKGINYVGASISPDIVLNNRSLSINVKATIVSAIDNAETYISVWKDGEDYLFVQIQDLCSIVRASTNSLSCPLQEGPISFTYTFNYAPILVTGDYRVKIQSVANGQETGCLELQGSVDGLVGTKCSFTSSFSVAIDGTAIYSEDNLYLQVGPYGNVPATRGTSAWGKFNGDFVGTDDVGGTISTVNYVWGVNATLTADPTTDADGVKTSPYSGALFVGHYGDAGLETVFTGFLFWTQINNPAATPVNTFTGYFTLNPKYTAPAALQFPTVIGNLGPFYMRRQDDGSFLVTGQHDWCTCGVDSCGVCGGDGSTCIVVQSDPSEWNTYRKTAVGVGVGGGFVGLVAVISLFYVLLKTKDRNRRRHDDQDLIDTPEKPDYGTLAIDDAMQEDL